MKKHKRRLTKILALVVALCMMLTTVVSASGYYYPTEDDPVEEYDNMSAVIDEAKELGVPNAFYRHFFATEFDEGNLEAPVTELVEGEDEQPDIDVHTVTTSAEKDGLEITKIDTGVLARTKIDLGEFNFSDFKVGKLVYNMLAKKTLKGTAYLYFGDSDEPFAEFKIKRCATDDWEETRNKVAYVDASKLNGEDHIYLKFVADSALDDDGNIIPLTKTKGNIYFESMFFTEGSTPVVDFDLDNEVNTIENVNGSEFHSIMACGNMNVQIPEGYTSEWTNKKVSSGSYELDYIRGRGNSTWLVDKKPYKIKLDKKADLFGMGKSKHWVLLANFYDYSLIRNRLTFDLGRQMNDQYTPKSVCVDVIISGEYYGSYQLCQHVRIGESELNINDLEDNPSAEESAITGGYLLSMGVSWLTEDESDVDFLEAANGRFRIEKPEYDKDYPEDAKEAQRNYINGYIDDLDKLVEAATDDNPDNDTIDGKTWRDYMDEDSFIDYYLMQDFAKNNDAFGSSSTYLYKKENDKLYWGPLWDFDFVAWAAFQTNYLSNDGADGFQMLSECPWFEKLVKHDEAFKQRVVERYNKLSGLVANATKEGGLIDKYSHEMYYSALANYQVRSTYLASGESYWGGTIELIDDDGEPYTLNYTNEMNRLKKYIDARKTWLDDNIGTIDEHSGESSDDLPAVKFIVDGQVVAEAHGDWDEYRLNPDEIPENPTKEGFKFKGWYYEDREGDEMQYQKDSWPYYYDDESEEYVACDIFARFISESEIVNPTSISFSKGKYYVPLYSYYDDEEEETYTESAYVDLSNYVNVIPFNADKDDLVWSVEDDVEGISVDEDGQIVVSEIGTYEITCKLGDLEAKTIIEAYDEEDSSEITGNVMDETLSLAKGEYGTLNYSLVPSKNTDYMQYSNVTFKVMDENVAEVNENGMVYAKNPGETLVVAVYSSEGNVDIKIAKVTVPGNDKKSDDKKSDDSKKKTDNTSDLEKVGTVISDGTYKYKITKAGSKDGKTVGEVSVIGLVNKKIKNINILNSITINNVKYNVTSIGAKAFFKNKKIVKAKFGSNVVSVGAKAFFGTKKFKKLIIKSKKLKKVGKKAFYRKKGKKLIIKVKKAKKKAYKKLFKKAKTNKFRIK